MKLENNSLKYGMNSANNANSAFNNAYNQEMANQRDMQQQVTERQKTLLGSLNSELAVGNEAVAGTGMSKGTGTYGGYSNTPWTPQTVAGVNTNVLGNKARYDKFYDEVQQTMPRRAMLGEDGKITYRESDRGFSYANPNVYGDPDVLAYAKKYDIDPRIAFMQLHPNVSASLPQWTMETK